MPNTQQLFDQLIALNPSQDTTDIRNQVLGRGEETIKTLMRDASQLAPDAASALARTYEDMGTSPRGQSAAGRMANAAFQREQAQSGLNQNRELRNYWRSSLNDTVDRANNRYGMEGDTIRQNYQLANQRDQEAWQRGFQERQLSAQLAANAQNKPMSWEEFVKLYEAKLNGGKGRDDAGRGRPATTTPNAWVSPATPQAAGLSANYGTDRTEFNTGYPVTDLGELTLAPGTKFP